MDWTSYAVPRLGGAILEGFDSDVVRELPPPARRQRVESIGNRIVQAILAAEDGVSSRREVVQDGCSSTGCVTSDTY